MHSAASDLGALVDGVSSQSTWISVNGLYAGVSQNGETDPLFPGFPENHAVLWRNGQISDLGTLPEGGYESWANAVNSKGQVTGWATNTIPDPYSMIAPGFLPTQTRAFLWQGGVMQDLGTLGTGSDATALLVNERGQIVGESYINSETSAYCSNAFGYALTTGAFIWEHGEMKNLGSFGGTCTFAADLNNQGVVVGLSTLPGDKFQHAFRWQNASFNELPNTLGGNNAAPIALNNSGDAVGWASLSGDQQIHASLWANDTMTDLGTVDGDPCSLGFSINARGQVVGISVPACDFSQVTRALLFEEGSIFDLNSLIPGNSPLYLTAPETINDSGEIAGVGLDSDGNQHAFLLIPCAPDDTACQDAATGSAFRPAPATTKPADHQNNAIRRMLRHRLGPLYKAPVSRTSSEPSASGGASSASGEEFLYESAPFDYLHERTAALSPGPYRAFSGEGGLSGHSPTSAEDSSATSTPTGHCSYHAGGTRSVALTGYCVGVVNGACRSAYDPGRCPRGARARRRGTTQCGVVDLSRLCTP